MDSRPQPSRPPKPVVSEVTDDMIELATSLQAKGKDVAEFGVGDLRKLANAMRTAKTHLELLEEDDRNHPNQAEVTRAIDEAKKRIQKFKGIEALLGKRAVDERGTVPNNKLN